MRKAMQLDDKNCMKKYVKYDAKIDAQYTAQSLKR